MQIPTPSTQKCVAGSFRTSKAYLRVWCGLARRGLSVPVSGSRRRYAKPPAATLLTGLARGELPSRFSASAGMPFYVLIAPSTGSNWNTLISSNVEKNESLQTFAMRSLRP